MPHWRTELPLRTDEIGFGGFKLLQDTDAYCYGVDAVLLADLAKARKTDNVLDMCCGNGAVSLIIEALYSPRSITGLEVQAEAADLARQSIRLNALEHKCSIICGDAKDAEHIFSPGSFSLVVCNPPYFEAGRGVSSDADTKRLARHESTAGIEDFIKASAYVLKKGGRLCLVHRPERLADIMSAARQHGLEPKLMRMVVPHSGDAPNLVLLQLVKGGGKELKILPELAVRTKDGGYTEELQKIYRRQ